MHKHLSIMAALGLALGSAGALRGAEVLPTEVADGTAVPEIELTTCGSGVLRECGSYTTHQCTQWAPTSGSGSVSYGPATGGSLSGSVSGTCVSFTDIKLKLYKDKYKAKTT